MGTITDLGAVPGRWAGADPGGRYATTVDGDALTTYTADLRPVASHAAGHPHLVATHPDGAAVAVLTADWAIEVWRDGRRIAARGTGLGGSPAVTAPLGGPDGAAWLTFTADGGHLLAGLAAPDGGPARIDLLDATTLARLDTSDALPGGYPDYDTGDPPTDWGEGVTVAVTADAVAIAANVGDDPHVLAVVDTAGGRLRPRTTAAGTAFAARVPGERITGIALDPTTLYVVDSDHSLTAFAWREADRPPRTVLAGHRLIAEMFGEDSGYECAGPVFVVGDRLALPLVGPDLVLVFLDPASGRRTGRLDVPAPWSGGFVENGWLWSDGGGTTRLARWTAGGT